MKKKDRIALLIVALLVALYVGFVIHCNMRDMARFERAQALAEPMTEADYAAANALNERAQQQDHLPTGW